MGADLLQLMRGAADFGVGAVGLEVVREDALPVGLLVGGDGGPVPVLDHVGAVGEMGVDVFAQLAVVGRVLAGGSPAGGLGVGFGDEEVAVLEGAGEVALDGLRSSVVVVLRAVIDVVGDDVEGRRRRLLR